MGKIFVVARTEFASAVRTKAFLVGILMLPLIYGSAIAMQIFAGRADTQPRPFAVVDRTGKLYEAVRRASETRNSLLSDSKGKATAPQFLPSTAGDEGRTPEETALALSERVRSGELYAFLEIPAEAVQAASGGPVPLKYYSNTPNYSDLRRFLEQVVRDAARTARYQAAGVDPKLAARIDRPLDTVNLELSTRSAPDASATAEGGQSPKGAIVEGKASDPIRSFGVPIALGFIVFMITISASPQLLTSVMEEKMSRISEMLLGSVSSFELMMGKLIGNAATALLTAALYLGGAYAAAARYGYADAVSPGLLATLALFVTLSVILFGSLYLAVGSACSEMKDAQSMMMPIMMLSMIPFFVLGPVINNPSGPVAVVGSLVPFASPILMPMRMAMSPAPPAWQVVMAVVLTALTALACVWASGKIFRTGLLMHGKTPTFREMLRWVVAR